MKTPQEMNLLAFMCCIGCVFVRVFLYFFHVSYFSAKVCDKKKVYTLLMCSIYIISSFRILQTLDSESNKKLEFISTKDATTCMYLEKSNPPYLNLNLSNSVKTLRINPFNPKPSLIYNVGGRFGDERVKLFDLLNVPSETWLRRVTQG